MVQDAGTSARSDRVAEERLRAVVADSGRILYQQGLIDYLGHCSARVPGSDRVVIKPKHSPTTRGAHSLAPGDMIVVDLDGRLVEGVERPPAEVFIHTEIYRARPDVQAVVHTHQSTATALGIMGSPLLPLLHVPSAMIGSGAIPVWPHAVLVTTRQRGQELALALGDAGVVHLQGHGIVSVAGDLRTATVQAVMLEQLAKANLDVLKAGGTPRVIPPDEIEDLRREMAPVTGRWAYYMQLLGEPT